MGVGNDKRNLIWKMMNYSELITNANFVSPMQFDVYDMVAFRHYLRFSEDGSALFATKEGEVSVAPFMSQSKEHGTWRMTGSTLEVGFPNGTRFLFTEIGETLRGEAINDVGYFDSPFVFNLVT